MDKKQLLAEIAEMKAVLNDADTPKETKDILSEAVKEAESQLKEIENAEKVVVAETKEEEKLQNTVKGIQKDIKVAAPKVKADLKKSLEKAKADLQKKKDKKATAEKKVMTTLASATKKARSILAKSSKKSKEFNKGRSEEDLKRDAPRKAKPIGWRKSEDGNWYFESRPNRSDIDRKKKPYLEDGGLITDWKNELEAVNINELDDFEQMQYHRMINRMPKANALQIIINTVEGDYSQLSDQLAEIAKKQDGFEDDEFAKGGKLSVDELRIKRVKEKISRYKEMIPKLIEKDHIKYKDLIDAYKDELKEEEEYLDYLLNDKIQKGEIDKKREVAKKDEVMNITGIPETLKHFIPKMQQLAIVGSKEHQEVIERLEDIIKRMPKTYETDKKATDDKIVYLHYFYGQSDWYIIEKDVEKEQLQAFGYTILNGDVEMGEWGYINIEELKSTNKVELDLYFEPIRFGDLKKEVKSNEFAKGGSIQDNKAVSELLQGYLEAILFSETDLDTEEPLDTTYTISDFDNDTITESKKMLQKFYSENKEAINESGLDLNTIGKDIWYTRAGHGVGFFDHSLDDGIEKQLIKAAKALGEYPTVETYDGKISVRGGRVFAFGGRIYQTGAAYTRDRHFKSKEPHEQRYERKTRPKNPKYQYAEDGALIHSSLNPHNEMGENINVFGYNTQHFDICPKAGQEFKKAINIMELERDNQSALWKSQTESLAKCAEYADSILGIRKLYADNGDKITELTISNIVEAVSLFSIYNYKSGLLINSEFISYHVAMIFEEKKNFEDGGALMSLQIGMNADPRFDILSPEFAKGGMIVGRWYKDRSGTDFKYVGDKNPETGVFIDRNNSYKNLSFEQFPEMPKEKKLFGLFADGGSIDSEVEKYSEKYKYMLLDIMKSDVQYYLRHPHEKHLWAGNVKDHISYMKAIYNSLKIKPDWISMEDILNYENEMIKTTKDPETEEYMGSIDDFYKWSRNKVEQKFGSSFIEGQPVAQWENFDDGIIVQAAIGELENGMKVKYDNEEFDWVESDEYAGGGRLKVDRKYTHFAVRKSDGKILTGWDYKGVDKEDISTFSKMDLKDMDIDPKTASIVTKSYLLSKGIDPFNWDNWRNPNEYYAKGGTTNDSEQWVKDVKHLRKQVDKIVLKDGSSVKGKELKQVMAKGGRIDEMVEHWQKYGWAGSQLGKDDDEFFKRIGRTAFNTPVTSFTGNDVKYYDDNRVDITTGGFKIKEFAKGGNKTSNDKNGTRKSPKKHDVVYDYNYGEFVITNAEFEKEVKLTKLSVSSTITVPIKTFIEKYKWDDNSQRWEGSNKIFAKGGKTTFADKVKAITASLTGKKVKPKYKKEYGKKYSGKEAAEVAKRIAGSMRKKEIAKKKG